MSKPAIQIKANDGRPVVEVSYGMMYLDEAEKFHEELGRQIQQVKDDLIAAKSSKIRTTSEH